MWRDGVIASFQCPTNLIFGVGAHEKLGDLFRARAARRALVLLDPALVDSTLHRKVVGVLSQQDVATVVFNVSDADPSGGIVQAALDWRRQHGADGLLAVGGNRTIDVAKAVGQLMPSLPLMAVPTTAGTRSAVSGACSLAILDPLTVSSMSAQDAAYAGIDAFVHAFESYLSKRATVFSDATNLQAMTLIAASIRAFVADRSNESAALDVLCGSSLAALSFRETGLGNVSSMASSVSALFPLSQGLASAVCLPHVAAFRAAASPERYARVAAILGVEGSGRREAQGGAQAIHGLRALCSDLGIPPRLRDIGVTEDRLDEMARRSAAETGEQDFRKLFRAAF